MGPSWHATTAAVATQLIFVLFPGLVLHRALATRLLLSADNCGNPNSKIRESDLVVYGLLPGLAIVNEIGTLLSLVKLFRIEVYVTIVSALILWRRSDARNTLTGLFELIQVVRQSICRRPLLSMVAFAIFLQTAFALVVLSHVPSINIDVWHHNLPLAQSIVSHTGFVLPQIPNMFYGTYPIFFHMFFAEALLLVDNIVAPKVINSCIYLSFLLSLLWAAGRTRGLAALILFFLIINNSAISAPAQDITTDIPRVCFSVLALVFTSRFIGDREPYFLFTAGLLAGGAVAGKYTELLTPVLIGVALLPPLLARRPDLWTSIGVFAAGFAPIACYPYLRNLILLHNPIYPFVFGHPGLTKEYMSSLQAEVFHSYDPLLRGHIVDLFTLHGWADFFDAVHRVFISGSTISYVMLCIIAIGLCSRPARLAYLALCAFVLFIFWYTVGTMNIRWGLTAYMTMVVTAFLSSVVFLDLVIERFRSSAGRGTDILHLGFATPLIARIPIRLSPNRAIHLGTAAVALYFAIAMMKPTLQYGWAGLLPKWAHRDVGKAVLAGELDLYLEKNLKGFQIYRFIGTHDLRTVLAPFDNGVGFFQTVYNNGRDGQWILPWYRLPRRESEFDEFVKTNNINYFVYRASLDPIEAERLDEAAGDRHVATAYELLSHLLPISHPILTDQFGWVLYAVGDARIP
jgi:hypothetical protein